MDLQEILGENPTQTLMAGWGALLSSVLGLMKIYESWQSRHRINISYNFTEDEHEGNKITIRNLSNRQIILTYWELFTAKHKYKWFSDRNYISSPDYDAEDNVITANSSFVLRFTGEFHFKWSAKARKNRPIFITLSIAGRRTATYLVYPD